MQGSSDENYCRICGLDPCPHAVQEVDGFGAPMKRSDVVKLCPVCRCELTPGRPCGICEVKLTLPSRIFIRATDDILGYEVSQVADPAGLAATESGWYEYISVDELERPHITEWREDDGLRSARCDLG